MFFALSKIAALFLKPLVWVAILLIASLLLRYKHARSSRRCAVFAILTVVLFSNPILLRVALRAWEIPAIPVEQLDISYQLGIVLGGYSNSLRSAPDKLVLGSDANRLTDAIRLYKTGKIKKLLLTGGTGAFFGKGVSEAPLAKQFLLDLGIPHADILVEAGSRNTNENAMFTAKLLSAEQKQRTSLLVTSAFHMRRARACFRKAGISVQPYATDLRGNEVIYSSFRDFLPDSWVLWQWEFLLREWAGTIAYRVTGRA